jgi:hypothetical protein
VRSPWRQGRSLSSRGFSGDVLVFSLPRPFSPNLWASVCIHHAATSAHAKFYPPHCVCHHAL